MVWLRTRPPLEVDFLRSLGVGNESALLWVLCGLVAEYLCAFYQRSLFHGLAMASESHGRQAQYREHFSRGSRASPRQDRLA